MVCLFMGMNMLFNGPSSRSLRMLSKRPNTVIKGLLQSNRPNKALLLFLSLRQRGSPAVDSFTVLFALKAAAKVNDVLLWQQMHAHVVRSGFQSVVFLQTTLMNMYAAMGNVVGVHRLFDEIPAKIKNIVSWTALISSYVDNGRPRKALELFRRMQMEAVEPDSVTLTITLSACADLGALDVGEWIHVYTRRKPDFETDLPLQNALINMYSKCGDINTSRSLFDGVSRRDAATWTSMITGHALHGQADEALKLFARMKTEDCRSRSNPNEITFVGVLMACSHAGLVEEGLHHFESMRRDYNIIPRISHYGCLVDLFCRSGRLNEAYNSIIDMPMRPNAIIWRTLMSACSVHGNFNLADLARQRLLLLEPDYIGDCVTTSNIYAAAGLWDEKAATREITNRQRRIPGCSLIEVNGNVHEFVAADNKHIENNQMHDILQSIVKNSSIREHSPRTSHLEFG